MFLFQLKHGISFFDFDGDSEADADDVLGKKGRSTVAE